MIKKIYILSMLAGIGLSHMSCTDEQQELQGDGDAISLYGIGTRANGDVYTNLHLKAFAAERSTQVYIQETPIAVTAGLYDDTPNNITFTNGKHYYPIGDNEIFLYAYSGSLNGTDMQLTSGKALTNDALLSNQGIQQGEPLSEEGDGTPGSSDKPAEILQFRHVMTQLNVIIKVDSTELPTFVDPPPTSISFRMGNNIPSTGRYSIYAEAPVDGQEASAEVAHNLSGSYTLTQGVNYVVPNGLDIRDFDFTSLVIDNYTATDTDLARLSIENLNLSAPAPLLVPGYAYDITFLVRRLEIQAITIELVRWNAQEVTNEDITYEPYVLDLDLGDYVNSGDDEIQKVVLYTTNGREYVGGLDENGLSFVTLPATGMVDSVDLYISLGLLISIRPDDYVSSATTSTLTVELSEGGTRLENPALPPADDNPYLIYTPVQIFNIAKDLTASYKQMEDLDVNRLSYSTASPLVPLETFEGVFDGNGYLIQNLIMTGPALIRRNEGTLKNLRIASGRINAAGEAIAGSFCAENAGTIVACMNEARIVNATNIVGGICGINEDDGKIIGCINTGNMDNGVILGGICGENQDPDEYTIIACINTGLLTKDGTNLGGIIGSSIESPEVVIDTSFWLVGTVAHEFGGLEIPVGIGNVGQEDVSSLSPEKLRNDLSALERETEAETTVILLNTALENTVWGNEYMYVLNQNLTGSVWPIPQKRTP
ncbi:MAG: fimbrillin family protein [Tannerellaceae bacterium]|nr:fimbrillin family protein [Tannerellaceae bacterium]